MKAALSQLVTTSILTWNILPVLPRLPLQRSGNTNWTSWWKIWRRGLAQSSNLLAPERSVLFESSVTSNLSAHRLGVSSAAQLSTSLLSTILPSISHPALFSILSYQTQPSGRISVQPWSVIKGWLWSAASQLKTLHKLPHIMFYSVLFQHLNNNFHLLQY